MVLLRLRPQTPGVEGNRLRLLQGPRVKVPVIRWRNSEPPQNLLRNHRLHRGARKIRQHQLERPDDYTSVFTPHSNLAVTSITPPGQSDAVILSEAARPCLRVVLSARAWLLLNQSELDGIKPKYPTTAAARPFRTHHAPRIKSLRSHSKQNVNPRRELH